MNDYNDVVKNMIEVDILNDDNFLKIKETLSRIGVLSTKSKTLYQSAHILHKRGKYYIVHFKELFLLDGKSSNFTESDKRRRNTIIRLLHEWNLLNVADSNFEKNSEFVPISQLKILSFEEKHEYQLVTKYTIGKIKGYTRSN